ncbi:MAG: hypothetical protein V4502_01155 [Pseudomonadota bacterium]
MFGDWREFTREFLIIVLGVLTALFAQQAVEALDWRQKVKSAIADMDQEMSSGNGPSAYARLSIHQCLADRLAKVRGLANAGDRAGLRRSIDSIQLPLKTYTSGAREAALSADIAARIPAATMYGYRIVYDLIPELNKVHEEELSRLADLRALPTTGGALTQQEKREVLAAAEGLMLDNDRMARASAFTLRWMRSLAIGLERPQVVRNLALVPTYRECRSVHIQPLLFFGTAMAAERMRR